LKKLVIIAAAAALALTGAVAASAWADPSGSASAGKNTASSLEWHACKQSIVDAAKAYDSLGPVKVSEIIQCAELQVPLDYDKPDGTKITLQLTNVPHQGSAEAKGDIVVNPGGPGGSGTSFAARVYAQNSPEMQAAYNVVGFDPRGVGDSVPALSCDPNYNNGPRPWYGHGEPEAVKVWLQRDKDYAAACARNDEVGLLAHAKTTDSAKDLNSIRAALGREKLDYYGASYGTYLGGVYATMFPKNVGRFALDGVVGPSDVWYEANLNQDVQFDKNINYYFGWIAKFDSRYHLGTTQKQVHDFYYATIEKLKAEPVLFTEPDGSVLGAGPDELTDNILTAGYRRSAAVWNLYATGLAAYKTGDMQTFAETYGGPTEGGADDNGFAIYNAVQCTDVQWPTSWKKWQRDNTRIDKKYPFETWGNAWFNAGCLYWGADAGKPVNVGKVKGLPNILLFQSTEDGATPYKGALDMHRRLKGSHLVVQDGDRTHCIVHRGAPDVDKYFDGFFLNGTLPEKETVHVAELGDPTPPAPAAQTTSRKASKDVVEREVIR
jgi:pimeloyl-ACP methyl ester carboxylesterase